VRVALLVAGVDRGQVDLGGDRRAERVVTIMCRAVKPTSLWTGSIVQVPAT